MGRDSSVVIATPYGLDGRGDRIPVWGEIFRTRPDRPWGPRSLPYNGYRGLSRGYSGRGVDHPPPSRTEVRKELHLYSPFGLSWHVLG